MWIDQAKRQLEETRGVLHVPMALGLALILFLGMGTWGVMRHWRRTVELQQRLDRCVGGIAMELRDTLEGIDADNERIEALRIAIAAGRALPAALPPLQAALGAVVVHQELLRGKWSFNRGLWQARRGCGSFADQPSPLPQLSLFRDPPDSLGPRGLRWIPARPERFRIHVRRSPRASAADVFRSNGWQAGWTGFP